MIVKISFVEEKDPIKNIENGGLIMYINDSNKLNYKKASFLAPSFNSIHSVKTI